MVARLDITYGMYTGVVSAIGAQLIVDASSTEAFMAAEQWVGGQRGDIDA